jgi:hypothetical protein
MSALLDRNDRGRAGVASIGDKPSNKAPADRPDLLKTGQ